MAGSVPIDRPLVREVMTSPVVTIDPETLLGDVARVLVDREISGAPVVDHMGRVLGVITEADLLPKEEDFLLKPRGWLESGDDRRLRGKRTALTARQAMTRGAISVNPDCSLQDAARIMDHQHLRRVLVVDEDNGLVGILSRRDVVRELARGDEDLRQAVLRRLEHGFGTGTLRLSIEVHGGLVDVGGWMSPQADPERLATLVAGVRGVSAVRNHVRVDRGPSRATDLQSGSD